jgi:hypothetical protein
MLLGGFRRKCSWVYVKILFHQLSGSTKDSYEKLVCRVEMLCFWTLSIVLSWSKKPPCLFFKTQLFCDWILSQETGTSTIDWVQLTSTFPFFYFLWNESKMYCFVCPCTETQYLLLSTSVVKIETMFTITNVIIRSSSLYLTLFLRMVYPQERTNCYGIFTNLYRCKCKCTTKHHNLQ